jgi:hypothetical protein
MNPGAVAGLLAGLLLGPVQTALAVAPPDAPSLQEPTFQAPILNTERIETGELRSATGATVTYRIRLLPIASFPDLPAAIADELNRRQCMIPQSFEAKQPENVIHGAFRASGSSDWAALCSSRGATTLYVFFAGQFESVPPMDRRGASPCARPPSCVHPRNCTAALRSITTPSTMRGSSAPSSFTTTRRDDGSTLTTVTPVTSQWRYRGIGNRQ